MEERRDTCPLLMLRHARERPQGPATREKDLGIWQTWTWSDVAAEVRALACGLAAEGFRRGMHLAIVGVQLNVRVDIYEAVSLLRMALNSMQKLKDQRLKNTMALLEARLGEATITRSA